EIEQRGGRAMSFGAVYVTLQRMEGKGLVTSRLGEPTAERGGRAKRVFPGTGEGRAAVRRGREGGGARARGGKESGGAAWMRTHAIWATRLLSCLLRDGDGTALLGDLVEERARRMTRDSRADAARWYQRELYRSLAAVLRLRTIECVRAVPWGIVAAAYV